METWTLYQKLPVSMSSYIIYLKQQNHLKGEQTSLS